MQRITKLTVRIIVYLLLKAYFKYFYTPEETTSLTNKVSNKQEQLHKLQAWMNTTKLKNKVSNRSIQVQKCN